MTDLITIEEAAHILKCSERTVNRYIQKGKLQPDQKVESKYLIHKEKILNFIRPKPSSTKNASFQSRPRCSFTEGNFTGVIEKWQIHFKDTSSADVQIGVYTEKIKQLELKLRQMPTEDPDFKKIRYNLLKCVGERRRLLKYLQVSDYRRYIKAINLLKEESKV